MVTGAAGYTNTYSQTYRQDSKKQAGVIVLFLRWLRRRILDRRSRWRGRCGCRHKLPHELVGTAAGYIQRLRRLLRGAALAASCAECNRSAHGLAGLGVDELSAQHDGGGVLCIVVAVVVDGADQRVIVAHGAR